MDTVVKEGGGSGMGLISIVLLLFLVFVVFSNFNGAMAGNRGTNGINYAIGGGNVYDQAALDGILATINQGNLTRQAVDQGNQMIATKIDFYAYENLRDELAQSRAKNMQLESTIASDRQFCALNQRLDVIQAGLPKVPPFYMDGFIPCGERFPRGCCNGVA